MVIERARLRRLAWSDADAVRELAADALRPPPRCAARSWRSDSPPERALPGFDLALGADVVYVAEAVPALFAAVATLLSASPEVGKEDLAFNSKECWLSSHSFVCYPAFDLALSADGVYTGEAFWRCLRRPPRCWRRLLRCAARGRLMLLFISDLAP